MTIIYVDSERKLQQMASQMDGAEIVAVDTEFDRSQTFYAKLGLIQLAFSNQPDIQYLVDTVELDPAVIITEGRLAELFANDSVIKVLHACGEDVEVLLHNFELKKVSNPITQLFDTQIAAAYLNINNQISYRDLVKHYHGVELSKEETRSDWMSRPLCDAQLAYAANDVAYLISCFREMKRSLESSGRLQWVFEDSGRFVSTCQKAEALDRYYLKFQQGWNFDQSQVALLRDLCVWREETARRMDTPRTHIVKDSSLYEIAEKQPSNLQGLLRMKSLKGKSRDIRHLKRYADQILGQINVLEEKGTAAPPHPIEPPLDRDLKSVFASCKQVVAAIAGERGVPPERLASKSEIRRLVAAYAHHLSTREPLVVSDQMSGWRRALILQPLLEVLDRYQSQLIEQYERRERKANRWLES